MTAEYRVLINGELCEASTKETMEVINPANGKVVGLAPKCSSVESGRSGLEGCACLGGEIAD